MNVFTDIERRYLIAQALGRLATIGPTGAPQVHPVTYCVNEGTSTVDIGGPDLKTSQKYRNIETDPRVSLVVDDIASEAVGPDGQRGRGLEIRGVVEVVEVDVPQMEGFTNDLLRVHPRRIVAWNLDRPGLKNRNVKRSGI